MTWLKWIFNREYIIKEVKEELHNKVDTDDMGLCSYAPNCPNYDNQNPICEEGNGRFYPSIEENIDHSHRIVYRSDCPIFGMIREQNTKLSGKHIEF